MLGCPIRISTDQKVCASPRSFSQLVASFIVSESLGIPHTPLLGLSPRVMLFCLFYSGQINYPSSIFRVSQYVNELFYAKNVIVENIGVEPMTSCVQGRRSSQLS